MMNTLNRSLAAAVLAALVAFTGGCGGAGMGKYNVTVVPGSSLRESPGGMPSVEVDLVGVSESEAARWKSYPINDYFSGRDQLRADADKKTLAFTAGSPGPQTLSAKDPIWQTWKGKQATELVILANLPGVSGKGEDPRRLVLPLASNRWEGDTIEVEVQRSGIVPRTPMKPAK
jgi:hypothetical protein